MAQWKINRGSNRAENHIVTQGKYLCTLSEVVEIQVLSKKTETKEPRLLFVFTPQKVSIPEGKECRITCILPPKMSKTSYLYKLLCNMDISGFVPEFALENEDAYEAYIKSFIGSSFIVRVAPSADGKYNNIIDLSVTPAPRRDTPVKTELPEASTNQVTSLEDDEIPF